MFQLQRGALTVLSLFLIVATSVGCGANPTATPIPPTATVAVLPTMALASEPTPPATVQPTLPAPTATATKAPPTATAIPPTAIATVAATKVPPTATALAPTTTPPLPTNVPTMAVAALAAPSITAVPAPTSTVIASLTDLVRPTLPTPPATPGPGSLGLSMIPLQSPFSDSLWLVHTTGSRSIKPLTNHYINIYRLGENNNWQEISRAELQCPDYLNAGSVKQVQTEPSRIWIQVDGGAGAHSGCFDLYSFDDKTLKHEATNTNSFSGNGRVQDLDGDGKGEIILDMSDAYVFCFACGVRNAEFKVLYWNGKGLTEAKLTRLPDTATANIRDLNNRSVTLAQGGLWKDAVATISQTVTLAASDPTVAMNAGLIRLHGEAQAKNIAIYPLLGDVFYGDYTSAVNLMRPYAPAQLFALPSPLISGTVASGWERSLTQSITQTASLALSVQPDLAPAYFARLGAESGDARQRCRHRRHQQGGRA